MSTQGDGRDSRLDTNYNYDNLFTQQLVGRQGKDKYLLGTLEFGGATMWTVRRKHGNCDSSASHNTPFDYFYTGDQNSWGAGPGQTGLEGGGRNWDIFTLRSTLD